MREGCSRRRERSPARSHDSVRNLPRETRVLLRAARERAAAAHAPLYSMPHLSLAMTGLPVRSLRKGFGLTGTLKQKFAGVREGAGEQTQDRQRRAPAWMRLTIAMAPCALPTCS